MRYGKRFLERGCSGADVAELQMRLSGFRGTVPDGNFGPGTELQVMAFQRDWMKFPSPDGRVGGETYDAIAEFAAAHPIDFKALKCPCGICKGFGQGRYRGLYASGGARSEASHRYEYPGIHRMLLWAYRAAMFHAGKRGLRLAITSGYRCAEDNRLNNRSSTNHHGKALDFQVADAAGKQGKCEQLRGMLVEHANAQVGWLAPNRKCIEPKELAPTWVHYDVRNYDAAFLEDRFFVRSAKELEAAPLLAAA
jgi:hypothetical protein